MQLSSVLKLLIVILLTWYAGAQVKLLPKFVTIKSNKVNTRIGPGLQYPITSIIVNKFEPVEVIAESGNWRQIKDYDKQISWVHVSLLSTKRAVIIKDTKNNTPILMYKTPFDNSLVIAKIDPKVRCTFLNYCNTKVCKVECQSVSGWIDRKMLWGIYDHEFIKDSRWELYFRSIF
jgi:SH3-like domain-containing protein